jgi:hypothetical protein
LSPKRAKVLKFKKTKEGNAAFQVRSQGAVFLRNFKNSGVEFTDVFRSLLNTPGYNKKD